MSLSLSIQWNFAKIPLVKIEQNNKNPIFQNKNAFFFIFGGVVTRSAFYKMFTILREDFFFTPDSSCHNTPNRFFASLTIFLGIFGKPIIFFNFLGVHAPPIKIWFIFVENWPRNKFSKLTISNPVLTT